jgi:uncharacterized protein (TIGR00730 family)
MISSVSVFCASSQKVDPVYFQDALELGEILAKNHIDVLYGGGAIGLMGCLADSILKNGGKITGIIPQFMLEQGWGHVKVDHIVVENMHERKKKLAENVDAIITLPGGVGTMEELLEMITLKQLGKLIAPIVILNTNGFFNPLLSLFEQMIKQHFMRDIHRNLWIIADKPSDVLDAIRNAPEWDGSAIKYAPA